MDYIFNELFQLHFYQTALISIGVFLADFIAGVTAGKRSGRRILSSIMRQCFSEKVTNYFYFFIIGLAFHLAGQIGNESPLEKVSAIIVLLPAIPEMRSIYENFKIIKSKVDTKPKEDKANDNK